MSVKDSQGDSVEILSLREKENSRQMKKSEREKGLRDWISLKEMIEKSLRCLSKCKSYLEDTSEANVIRHNVRLIYLFQIIL